MDNIFQQALTIDEAQVIQTIKKNKAFAHTILRDMANFYHMETNVQDDIKSVQFIVGKYRWCDRDFVINATKNGVFFVIKILGYRKLINPENNPTIKEFGNLYEKYKETSKADNGFLSEHRHGYVEFRIQLVEENLTDTIRDIMFILEHEHYRKKF